MARKVDGINKDEKEGWESYSKQSMAFHWLIPCQEKKRSLSSSYWTHYCHKAWESPFWSANIFNWSFSSLIPHLDGSTHENQSMSYTTLTEKGKNPHDQFKNKKHLTWISHGFTCIPHPECMTKTTTIL